MIMLSLCIAVKLPKLSKIENFKIYYPINTRSHLSIHCLTPEGKSESEQGILKWLKIP